MKGEVERDAVMSMRLKVLPELIDPWKREKSPEPTEGNTDAPRRNRVEGAKRR